MTYGNWKKGIINKRCNDKYFTLHYNVFVQEVFL
jgi:hypothetical protein